MRHPNVGEMRLHLVALPHVRLGTSSTHLCAYSGKIMKFCKMMGDRNEVFLYAPESDPVPGARLIQCLSEHARIAIFGKDDPNRLPDWPTDEQSRLFNLAATAKIAEHADPQNLVLLSGGWTHRPILEALSAMLCAEPFCGYPGILTERVAFESYAWMHSVYAKKGIENIRWYDRVIPPFCDPDEFPHLNNGRGDYLLFVGRMIGRKGPHIALQIAKAAKMPLYVAGAGGDGGFGGDINYLGPVGIEERAKLMAGARALICPTTYVEPGGNVAIEAMMSGTPVIAPDCGVFSETVSHGLSGFHFRTLRTGVDAVETATELRPDKIRAYARERYSLEAIAPKFERWFDDLQQLWGDGWNTL